MSWKLLNAVLTLGILTIGCIVTGQEPETQPTLAEQAVTTEATAAVQDAATAGQTAAAAAAAETSAAEAEDTTQPQPLPVVTTKSEATEEVGGTESPTEAGTQSDTVVGADSAQTTKPDDTAETTGTEETKEETIAAGGGDATTASSPTEDKTTMEPEEQAQTTAPPEKPVVVVDEGPKIKFPDGPTYRVSTILLPPFVDERPVNGSNGTQTELVGYIIDLLNHISENLGANFNISMVKDGAFGKWDGNDWTGIIGEVARGEADIGAAPMTVTVDRDDVVDFTYSFMSFEAVAVIYRRHRLEIPRIETLEDMVEDKFQFAVTKGSNILKILESSKKQAHKDIVESIKSGDWEMADNNKGIRRARWDRKYAFLMESSAANLITRSEPCDLEMIKTGIYRRKYAFVVGNLSPLRDTLNKAIVDLQAEDVFPTLMNTWFGEDECSSSGYVSGSLFSVAVLLVISLCFSR